MPEALGRFHNLLLKVRKLICNNSCFNTLIYIRVFQPWNHCHFGPDNLGVVDNCGGCPVYSTTFRSMSGPYMLEASNPPSPVVKPKLCPHISRCLLGDKIFPGWEPLIYVENCWFCNLLKLNYINEKVYCPLFSIK